MTSRTKRWLIATAGFVLAGGTARAQQETPSPQAMQLQAARVAQERARESEAAARAFLFHVAPERVPGFPGTGGMLDSLKALSLDAYWMEVGQLVAQFDLVQKLVRQDSVRAGLVGRMFGLEVNARALQRTYRGAAEAQRGLIRKQLETLISHHFEVEDQLRALEVADIERRLAQVRSETERRREKRAEFVKWAVDDIIRDAMKP